jgi:hypothetical protein
MGAVKIARAVLVKERLSRNALMLRVMATLEGNENPSDGPTAGRSRKFVPVRAGARNIALR